MSKKYDYAVFIGRFQPFHIGHYHVVSKALDLAENVILVIGSHDRPRGIRNPFTTQERIDIIKATGLPMERIHFAPQVDYMYNDDRWIASIQASVDAIVFSKWKAGPTKVCIIGYDKDHSSYYLKKFPQWELEQIEEKYLDVDATTIRKEMFGGSLITIPEMCTTKVNVSADHTVNKLHKRSIETFGLAVYPLLHAEWSHIEQYKKQWSVAPYPVTFVTVDAVVTQAGHVLMVERGALPGKGLWALPGGFINEKETLLESALRELTEETKIKAPKPVLVGSITKDRTYDAPNRSTRGRTITHAFHFKLNDIDTGLPKVKGSDDAKKAFWVPYSSIKQNRNKIFEDHVDIISDMIGI